MARSRSEIWRIQRLSFVVAATTFIASVALAEEGQSVETFAAKDTLSVAKDASDDAQSCLAGLAWQPGKFTVTSSTKPNAEFDRLIQFPSPIASGDEQNDSVGMEWFAARDSNNALVSAPAVIVVHESGSGMTVGRLFARGLRAKGLHAFMLHLPYYGSRRGENHRRDKQNVLISMRQAVADVRRARDAVAVLPNVQPRSVALQGTSLGGFVATTAASLDDGFASVFIMLAGGDLYRLLQNGQKDTVKVRRRLAAAGYTDDKLKSLLWRIEPTRVAHRLRPRTTWLYSAEQDTVVPIENAVALATAAKLDRQHHMRLNGNHYSTIVWFPVILDHMVKQIEAANRPE